MNKSQSAAKAASSTSSPKSAAPKQPAAKRDDHGHERKSETPCAGCGTPYIHASGFCSKCFNVARKPKKEGLTGDALVAAVKALLAEPKHRTTAAKQKSAKPAAAKKPTPQAAAPVTVDDALTAHAALYSQTAADAPSAAPVAETAETR